MTRLSLSCFSPSPFIIKSTPASRITTSSEQAASANAAPANAQEGSHTPLRQHAPPPPKKRPRIGPFKLDIGIPGTANRKTAITYIPLGGTISAEGTEHAYKAGEISGKALLKTAHVPHNVRITIEDNPPFTMDSKDLSPEHLLALRSNILKKLETADSIVLTHGSDTMAVSAFFLHLTIPKEKMTGKKIIFAGSMKPANFEKPDGPKNLSNAMRLAKTPNLQGIMVVMNASGEVFSPPYFDKKHTDTVAAFKAVNSKPAAHITRIPLLNKHVVSIKNEPAAPARTFDIGDTQNLPYVPVIQSQASVDPATIIEDIQTKIGKGARAIVYAGTGNGTIHQRIEAAIPGIIAETGVPIIRATKVGDGEVTRNDTFKDDLHGTICAGKLVPDMAVILAQVAIAEAAHQGSGMASDALRTAFDDYQTAKKEEEHAV